MKKLSIILFCLTFMFTLASCANNPPKECTCELGESPDLAVYSIYYHANSGELSAFNPVAYNYFTPAFTLNNPTRDGYSFLGWSKSEDLDTPLLVMEVSSGTTGDLNFYAVWGRLYSLRVESGALGFISIEYLNDAVLYGEIVTVKITPLPSDISGFVITGLTWWKTGNFYQEPDSCIFVEEFGYYIAKFTLTKDTVAGVSIIGGQV